MGRPRRDQAVEAVRTLIHWIEGEEREGTLETPERVVKAWENDWGSGYAHNAHRLSRLRGSHRLCDDAGTGEVDASELVKLFAQPSTRHQGIVLVRELSFFSTCEHHLAPFFGKADVGYIPTSKGVLGISKFARIVDHFARRLQVQERLTEEITNFLCAHVSPDVVVSMRATHMCMVSRGVRQPTSETVTASVRGAFEHDLAARAEFYELRRAK